MVINHTKKGLELASEEFKKHSFKLEFIVAFIIAVLLIASLILENYIKIPFALTSILIFIFIGIKVHNIVKKENVILEDILSLGILIVFLVTHFFMAKSFGALPIAAVSLVLLYSIGLMPKFNALMESRSVSSFILSYAIFVLIIVFLFAGFYSSSNTSFIEQGQATSLTFGDCLYFSTVTFTTVGYGDISPLDTNRTIAMIESLTGSVLNIAVIGYILASKRF